MSTYRRHALAVADQALRKHPWIARLPRADRRDLEQLAAAVALGVAEALEELDAAVYNAPTGSRVPAVLRSTGA